MNWEAVGAIGEVVGAAGVIATLGYLAIQIRQNTKALRTDSYRAWSEQINRFNTLSVEIPGFADINMRAFTSPESLSDEEWSKVSSVWLSIMHLFETLYIGAMEGTVDQKLWKAEEQSLLHFIAQPAVAKWWDLNPYGFTLDFRQHVDSLPAKDVDKGEVISAYLRSPYNRRAE